jgi:pyruvate,orthophosphate dikinase
MFFEPERLALVRRMILAAHATGQRPDDETARSEYGRCLSELEEIQTGDFEGIFRAMSGRPVVVRLLDPPLHEFLPSYDDLLADVIGGRFGAAGSEALAEKESLLAAVDDMRETNPMLGLRGCRLGLMYPDIYAMQARAVARAASALAAEGDGADVEIMVPLVSHENEMRGLRELLERTIDDYRQRADVAVDFKIGAMIETPRAALTADRIVESAEFLSFGTNDLTQATFAISRDDAEGKFLTHYVEEGILPQDPFKVVDADGVGRLVGICCELAKQARPDVSVGVCGEHGGDPDSIELFHALGLDYVSCSPYRVPTARLAAAQAALRSRTE